MNDLIVREDKELKGLDESKAAQIKAVFQPMVKMLEDFEEQYNQVIALEVNPETCATAKRLRLDVAKVRIAADKVRAEQKAEYLRAGNAIQGVYNILKFAVTDKEEKLKDIETFYERQEEEKAAQFQSSREAELLMYNFDGSSLNLGTMEESVWTNFLNGTKLNYEAVKAAEVKAENDRLEKEKADRAEQERIRAENEQLKKDAAEREATAKVEREKAEAEKKKQDDILQAERDARGSAERATREKEEARLQAEKIEADRIATEAAEKAAAPDLDRLNEIYKYLREQYSLATGNIAKNGIAEAGKLITDAIKGLENV